MNKSLLMLIFVVFLYSCGTSTNEGSLSRFFFPWQSLGEAKTYVYQVKKEDGSISINYNRIQFKGDLLSIRIFNEDFEETDIIIEEISERGIQFQELKTRINGQMYTGEITEPLIYPFRSSEKVKATILIGPESEKLKHELCLEFDDISKIMFQSKEYECAVFNFQITINDDDRNQMKGEMYYADQIGVVKQVSSYEGASWEEYLIKIISDEEFEHLRGTSQ